MEVFQKNPVSLCLELLIKFRINDAKNNVAFYRAMWNMIVVCSVNNASIDPYWKCWISHLADDKTRHYHNESK